MEDREQRFLGSLYGTGTSFAGAVWDSDSISPALMTMQGGGRQPHIIEVIKLNNEIRLGNVYNNEKFDGGNFGGNVWGARNSTNDENRSKRKPTMHSNSRKDE